MTRTIDRELADLRYRLMGDSPDAEWCRDRLLDLYEIVSSLNAKIERLEAELGPKIEIVGMPAQADESLTT